MNRWITRCLAIAVAGCGLMVDSAWVARAGNGALNEPGPHSLRSLEMRALEAQALRRRVEELETYLAATLNGGGGVIGTDNWPVGLLAPPGTGAPTRSLRELEQHSLQAGALKRRVEQLRDQLASCRERLKEKKTAMDQLRAERDQVINQRDALESEWKALQRERDQQDKLLVMYRSGDFEYYQVREGDTTRSIAANPMVYGDANRAVWIEHANGLDESDRLIPGTILVIPRFPEGFIDDL